MLVARSITGFWREPPPSLLNGRRMLHSGASTAKALISSAPPKEKVEVHGEPNRGRGANACTGRQQPSCVLVGPKDLESTIQGLRCSNVSKDVDTFDSRPRARSGECTVVALACHPARMELRSHRSGRRMSVGSRSTFGGDLSGAASSSVTFVGFGASSVLHA